MSLPRLESAKQSEFPSWRIGLVVDHPRRDLEGLVHLARALMARGQRPVLVPMYQQGIDQALLGLDAIVVNYYRPNNAAALQEWRADKAAVFVLDTEGGVLSESGHDSPQAFAAALSGLHAANGIDGYLFWGEKLADAVRAGAVLPEERIAVTGCPRFDLCAEPWRRRLGQPLRDHILINTNFSLINPAQTHGADQEANSMIKSGWAADYVQVLIGDLHAVFASYLDCLETLTGTLSDQRFRIRPHPFEDESAYVQRFAKHANVEIDGRGNVASAIQRSACVLHLNCGSAVEAAMLDRVPVQLEFLNTPIQRAHAPLPARVSRHAANLGELVQLLRQPERLTENFDLAGAVDRELKPYFGALDGRAAERAASYIVRRLAQLEVGFRKGSLGRALGSGRQRAGAGQILQGVLGTLLGTAAAARLREGLQPARREKRLDIERIDSVAQELADCENGSPARAARARHPLSGLPLESITIMPVQAPT